MLKGARWNYFKSMAAADGIPYQTLINQNLMDCADNRRKNSNVLAVMKKRKNNVFFRFFYCYYISIKYSYLQNYKKQEGRGRDS